MEVEDDLTQLAAAHLIVRYESEDGKRYLQSSPWRHHREDRPTERLPLPRLPDPKVEQRDEDAPAGSQRQSLRPQ